MAERDLRERTVDAWHRQLNDGRVEIMCKSATHRIRVTAPEDQAWEAVELFEKWTGLTIASERRPRRRAPQLPGQLAMTELESDSNDGSGDSAPVGEQTPLDPDREALRGTI
jgi:hypothetical protein